jgi:hypothetical protein
MELANTEHGVVRLATSYSQCSVFPFGPQNYREDRRSSGPAVNHNHPVHC